MSLTKNKKILEYFYKKYFLKIKDNFNNSKEELLDIRFNNCDTSYTKNLEEIDLRNCGLTGFIPDCLWTALPKLYSRGYH